MNAFPLEGLEEYNSNKAAKMTKKTERVKREREKERERKREKDKETGRKEQRGRTAMDASQTSPFGCHEDFGHDWRSAALVCSHSNQTDI